jgi:hypothetical protein
LSAPVFKFQELTPTMVGVETNTILVTGGNLSTSRKLGTLAP